MSKVLPLEGPHKHHHSHGKDASVPGKGPSAPGRPHQEHYEMILKRNTTTQAGFEWGPRKSKDRPCTHTKVNECDH